MQPTIPSPCPTSQGLSFWVLLTNVFYKLIWYHETTAPASVFETDAEWRPQPARLRETGNPQALQEQMGHTTAKMTLRYLDPDGR